ncbi:unnamed protein product, partial [Pylaiella littoralis]
MHRLRRLLTGCRCTFNPSPPSATLLPSASNAKGQQTGRSVDNGGGGGDYFDDASFLSSSVSASEGGGDLGRQFCRQRVSPPPPVVFIEGEGRNVSWRPRDDDRLLRRDVGGGAGGAEVMRGVPDGGDARLILTATGGGRDDGEGGDEGAGEAEPREIRVTTGQLESAGSESENLGARRVRDEVWVELAGMLALSTSEPTAGLTNVVGTTAAELPAAGEAAQPLEPAPTVSPEL